MLLEALIPYESVFSRVVTLATVIVATVCSSAIGIAQALPDSLSIDAEVTRVMSRTRAQGMAVAVVDRGKVVHVQAYGVRDARSHPLTADTIMYGASLTKSVFAYTVMQQLVERGKLDLDTPLKTYLERPLPSYGPDPATPDKYGPYKDLAGDSRWEKITARMSLTHSTGFSNFWFAEPDRKLRIHFEPGARYSYSGEGLILLQFVIEHGRKAQGLGLDVGELTNVVFKQLGMTRTSLIWRDDFAANLADGWDDQGRSHRHDERSKVRASGSLDTTISDIAKFASALVRGDGLSTASRREMTRPQLHIKTAHQFPLFLPDLPADKQRKDLHAGLGLIVFDGPQGRGFFKGGHDAQTANTMVCLEARARCVVILANDVRAEAGFAGLVQFILGETGVPYDWEYGDQAGKS